jgi:glycosyltransferase involved in cell wall biosynthesis
MRFLMLSWRDPVNPMAGGAERVSLGYLGALVDRGHDVWWYANAFPGGAPAETVRGIKLVRGGGKGTSILKAVRWYRQQQPFDLVIDQHHGIPWFAPWWCRTNCIAYLHEVLGPIWRAFYPWPLSTVGQWQERWMHWLYRNVTFWVGSESTQRALHRRGVREVAVIHYGIDLEPLAELEPKSLRQPLELIAVSRLAPNKRIDHAIQAVSILLRRGIEANLTIVGTGAAESQLRQMASQLGLSGRISFTGLLSEAEKDARLRGAHLLVHTSIREGWGLNVLEANALGTPAIVYPVDGLVDATLHGQTGIVARQETPESLAEDLAGLLKTPELYQRFRANACERTKAFQWRQILPPACDWLEKQAAKPRTQTQLKARARRL